MPHLNRSSARLERLQLRILNEVIPEVTDPSPIKLLVPSMPRADQLWPWLQRIDGDTRIFGPLCRLLERELGELIGASHVISVTNCTLGLELALESAEFLEAVEFSYPHSHFPPPLAPSPA